MSVVGFAFFIFGALFLSGCALSRANVDPLTSGQARADMQPALKEEIVRQLASELSLSQAAALAAERNPGVEAERRRWLAAIHVEPQATSLDDPTFQFGYQFRSVETRVGAQRRSFGLTQKIPWPEKLILRGKAARRRADVAQLKYEAAMRDLIVQVKDAWYELYYIDRALEITRRVEELLRNEATLAYGEMETGRAQLRDAFRAESQAAQLAYDRILLAEQRAAQAERLRSLLNLPPATEIGPVRSAPLYEVADSVEPLYRRAELYSEVLKMRGLETQRARYETELAKLARIPDIGVGLTVIQTDAGGTGIMKDLNDRGKNPIIGLLTMNLPIWEQRNRAVIREGEALEEAARRQALDDANTVRAAVARAYFQVRLTERLAKLYAETLLPQAEAVMRQAEIDFRNDQASFSNLFEATLAWHNFQLAHHRALADRGQAIGRLEQALGTTAEEKLTMKNEKRTTDNAK